MVKREKTCSSILRGFLRPLESFISLFFLLPNINISICAIGVRKKKRNLNTWR